MLFADRGHGWDRRMGHHSWQWIAAMLLVLAAIATLAFVAARILRRNAIAGSPAAPIAPAAAAASATDGAEVILAERLARGEIEPDDYRARLAVLREPTAIVTAPTTSTLPAPTIATEPES